MYFHIIGCGRGGTSLLAGLLDYNTQLEVEFEAHAISLLMGSTLSKNDQAPANRLTAYLAACFHDASHCGSKKWGNKITTEQICSLEELTSDRSYLESNEAFKLFFDALTDNVKIVFILRDGRSCIASKVTRTDQSLDQATDRWLYSVNCYRYLRSSHTNSLFIQFEDLVRQPEITLRTVCDFLEVRYEERMLLGSSNKKMLTEYQRPDLDLSRIVPVNLPNEIHNKIRNALIYCGYEV